MPDSNDSSPTNLPITEDTTAIPRHLPHQSIATEQIDGELSKSLFAYFDSNKGALIHKWEHYFPIYERHFRRFVGKCPRLLEIGVSHGGSLQMWKNYFGNGCTVVGLDCDPRCATLAEDGITILIGDQGNRDYLRHTVSKLGPFDIVIDDGGHQMLQQIASFQELIEVVTARGVYLVEDLHTSYWSEFGGGYQQKGTFIEFAKDLVDQLNGCHNRQGLGVTNMTHMLESILFYDSVIVFEKSPKQPLVSRSTGMRSF